MVACLVHVPFLLTMRVYGNPCKPQFLFYEGDPRSNANPSVISFTFGISKNGLHVYNDILSIL